MEYRLKTIQPYFNELKFGLKNFEIRCDDRDYQVGDVLLLLEYDGFSFTGDVVERIVKYKLKDCPQFGLLDGYCILGF